MIITIAITIIVIYLVILSILFFYLNKRQVKLLELLAVQTKRMDDLLPELELMRANQATLRDNDGILAKDIETLLHEFKAIEKKVKILRLS